jgi:hypothetical protein
MKQGDLSMWWISVDMKWAAEIYPNIPAAARKDLLLLIRKEYGGPLHADSPLNVPEGQMDEFQWPFVYGRPEQEKFREVLKKAEETVREKYGLKLEDFSL